MSGKSIPKGGGSYRVGNPYVVAGRTYVPREDPSYRAEGVASWYGDWFHGRTTANGEKFDMHSISAAHPTLPLPSYVRVTNLENNLSLVVRLNDRGPYRDDRVIDLSVKAAKLLRFHDRGLARVRVEYLGPAKLEGSDDNRLAATLRHENPYRIDLAGSIRLTAVRDQGIEPLTLTSKVTDGRPDIGSDGDRLAGTEAPNTLDEHFPGRVFD